MQYGLAALSAVLKAHGHQCDLVLIENMGDRDVVDKKIEVFQPQVIGFTAVSTQYTYIRQIARHVTAAYPGLFRICGGPHASLNPEDVLDDECFDAVCVGEGEYPLLDLVNALGGGTDHLHIENLQFRLPDGRVLRNATRPFVEDLDSLPFVDRDLFGEYVDLDSHPHSVLTTRGCPFGCTYCCNHAFRKLACGRYIRSRSVANILEEIRELQRRHPLMDYLYIEDETIGLNRKLWDALLPALKSTGLSFGCNYRIGVAPLPFLDALRDTNFVRINVGIESGNEYIRREVLNRRYSNEDIVTTFRHARRIGMQTKSYNLIGLPRETPAMFEDTVRVNRQAKPDTSVLNIFYPYPGTQLDKLCDELGLKARDPSEPIRERTTSILALPDFPPDVLAWYFDNWHVLTRGGIRAGLCYLKRSLRI